MSGDKPGPDKSVVTEQIIEFCAERMAYRAHKSALKRELSCILFGPKVNGEGVVEDEEIPSRLMGQDSYEKIRRKARQLLHERSILVTKEARSDSVGLYEAIVRDENASAKDRMTAQQNLDKIHNVTSPDILPSTNLGFVPIDKLGLTQEQKVKLLDSMTDSKQQEE